MTTPRSYIDPDQQSTTSPTSFQAEQNEHAVRCGMCARTTYVDEETFLFLSEAIVSESDNPFRCEVCKEEYDDFVCEH